MGRVALQRGPIVYCLEAVDNEGRVRNLALPPSSEIVPEHRADMLGGVTVLKGQALARQAEDWRGALYREAPAATAVGFVAVPYYSWDNREPGEMVVWLPECVALAEAPPTPTVENTSKVSASHTHDTLEALSDGVEPANSDDNEIPRFTWWNHQGTSEWVQYEFAEPTRVSGIEVYWFDDRPRGGQCRVPKAWTLKYKEGGDWKPVSGKSAYGVDRDRYNRVTFDPVVAEGLRIEVECQPDMSSGILEWKVICG